MARLMYEETTTVYRAVVTLAYWKNGEVTHEITEVFGPFIDSGQAYAAVTRAEREALRLVDRNREYTKLTGADPVGIEVVASVEKSDVNWISI